MIRMFHVKHRVLWYDAADERFHVKHLTDGDRATATALINGISADVSSDTVDLLLRHLEWLLETTKTLNLTAVKDPTLAARLHLVDSLVASAEVAAAPAGLLVDVGTGGGYPGLPLALVNDRPALLVDSVRKKVDALQRFLLYERLEARVSVSAERAETLGRTHAGLAAVVTARAVAELPVLVELAAPLLMRRGVLVAMKAKLTAEERERGDAAAALCGMRLKSTRECVLPGGDEVRTIVAYERVGVSKRALPRRVGLAKSKPLA